MAEQFEGEGVQFLMSDFNTRLREIDERNRLIRERVLLLGKNLISSKQETEEDIRFLREENRQIKKDIERIKKIASSLLNEFDRFVKRDEVVLIERMLKDFQPIEFMRRKDVEELLNEKESKKQIKTKNHN